MASRAYGRSLSTVRMVLANTKVELTDIDRSFRQILEKDKESTLACVEKHCTTSKKPVANCDCIWHPPTIFAFHHFSMSKKRKRIWAISINHKRRIFVSAWFLQTAILRAFLSFLSGNLRMVPKIGKEGKYLIEWKYLGREQE